MQAMLLSTLRQALPRGPIAAGPYRRKPAPRQLCKPCPVWSQEFSLPSEGFFDSELVQQELQRLEREGSATQPLLELFPAMSIEGKRTTLEELEGVSERFEIFYTRLRLSEDPSARAYLGRMQASMLSQGATWDGFFRTKRAFFAVLRSLVDREEQLRSVGDFQAVALVCDAQAAWLGGRYSELEEAHRRRNGQLSG